MRPLLLANLLLVCVSFTAAQNLKSRETIALGLLKRNHSGVNWTRSIMLRGDFDFDGVADTAYGTSNGKTYFVGIVRGGKRLKSKTAVLRFVENSSDQASLCSVAKAKIRLERISQSQTGLKGIRNGSRGINVFDDECDSFHIYFDQRQRSFTWWRL